MPFSLLLSYSRVRRDRGSLPPRDTNKRGEQAIYVTRDEDGAQEGAKRPKAKSKKEEEDANQTQRRDMC